jgi:hypothetical protein
MADAKIEAEAEATAAVPEPDVQAEVGAAGLTGMAEREVRGLTDELAFAVQKGDKETEAAVRDELKRYGISAADATKRVKAKVAAGAEVETTAEAGAEKR